LGTIKANIDMVKGTWICLWGTDIHGLYIPTGDWR
jgi:hypothetical protein